ncbi:MAG: hypothetical protein RLZZ623_574 [Actinomycetota bacterium]
MTDDRSRIAELLGREPQGRYEVVARRADGDPVVLKNEPILDDGTPMPTRYWLVGPDEVLAVSRLESTGGVRRAEADIDPALVADAHRRYGVERESAIPAAHTGPRPFGGVAGTREGIKCLHAHYAWYLAGGDDPVGAWVHCQLHPMTHLLVGATSLTAVIDAITHVLPVGVVHVRDTLADSDPDSDPPPPEALTNAIGLVTDHLDDLVRVAPAIVGASVAVCGPQMDAIAAVELGGAARLPFVLTREAAEDVFRTLATERSSDRRRNPGLPESQVVAVVAGCCILVAIMRRLHLHEITITGPTLIGPGSDAT